MKIPWFNYCTIGTWTKERNQLNEGLLKDDFENSGLCIDGRLPNKSNLYSRLIV